jgi:hypothetical protein
MKKAVILFNNDLDKFVNVTADRIFVNEEHGFIIVSEGNAAVGVFDMGSIAAAYLTEMKER